MSGQSELQAIRNEIDTIRCRSSLVMADRELVQEVLSLREEVARLRSSIRPVEAGVPNKPKSELVVFMEAQALIARYIDTEAERLSRKVRSIESGSLDAEADADEKTRNDRIAEMALERLSQCEARASHGDLFTGTPA